MWIVFLIILSWQTGQDPEAQYVPMPDMDTCVVNVKHLMESAQYADDVHYAAGCQLEPAGRPA